MDLAAQHERGRWKITGFLHINHLGKQVFEENVNVGKYVFNILTSMHENVPHSLL